jgi:hypothetical protein
MEGADALNT